MAPASNSGVAEGAAPASVQLGWLGGTLGYNLRRAQNASFQAFSELTGDTGLRPGRYAVLQLIADNPGISQTALSSAVGRDKSTLTPLLADLERRRLILREPDPSDRRGRRISLTKAGTAKLAQLAECANRHEARLNAVFKPKQREQLLSLLTKLINALDRGAPLPPSIADKD
ncbi:MAG: MarR family transcriptional regulator [Acetobacteraceae bacterium]|nr:MarR family transcriptional regulator [Acetobacteraceae bacterium]